MVFRFLWCVTNAKLAGVNGSVVANTGRHRVAYGWSEREGLFLIGRGGELYLIIRLCERQL